MPLSRAWNKRKRTKKDHCYGAASHVAVFLLIGLAIIAPLEPAFAQSVPSGADSPDTATSATPQGDTAPIADTPLAPDTSASDVSEPAAPEITPPPATTDDAATDDTTVATDKTTKKSDALLSSNLAAQQTGPDLQPVVYNSFNQSQVKIDKNTGSLNTAYPIDIPPGRNNVQPDVDLVYSSQNSQQGSIFGEGWSVAIPYIERLDLNGVDALYSTSTPSYFTSSVDGQLATTTVSSAYVARTENGNFNKYAFSNNKWVVTDKNGTQFIYGSSTQSQQNDPGNAARVYRWMLEQVKDTNANTVNYTYFKDAGQIYPASITYTGNGSDPGIFEVDFLRTASTDNGASFQSGFGVSSNYRVSEIDAKVSGTWVRKYVLGYATGDNGYTTLLSSITESGQDSLGNVTSLPPSLFSYQAQTPGWNSSSTWNPPATFVGNLGLDNGLRVADANGDSLSDIISSGGSWINNGNGWTSSSTWTPPVSFSAGGTDSGVRVVDVNGDALPDLISDSGLYINTGHGWTSSSTWTSPISFATSGVSNGTIIADTNGDGLPDLISGYTDASSTAHYASYVNNGHGWASSTTWLPPLAFVAAGGVDTGARMADVNGDGLPDILSGYTDASSTAHYASYINNGHGWASSTVWLPPAAFVSDGGWDGGLRLTDVNGDGLPDIISGYADISGNNHYAAYINTGHGWASNSAWVPPALFDANGGYDEGSRIADVNGDGLPDILSGYAGISSSTYYAAWVNGNNNRADLLANITYPQGGSSAIQYKPAAQFTNSSGAVASQAPYPVYVVSRLATNDGFGNIAPLSYQYSGGTYYYNGPFDHQFAGFGLVTQTDGASNVTKTYYHTGSGSDSANGEYADNFWKIGKPYRVESYDNAGHLYKTTITKWNSASLGGGAAFVFPAQAVELDHDGLSTHADTAESYAYDNATGNRTQKIQWGQVSGSSDGTFVDAGSDKYTTNVAYASSTGAGVIGKASDEILTNQSGAKIQETQYYYDSLALGSAGAGDLTKQQDWKSGSAYATTVQNTYNSYGLVTQALDARSNATTYLYDAYNLYSATTTNALSQATGYQYDYSTGKPTQTVDPNHLTFQTTYDGLGRTLQVKQPDQGVPATLDVRTAYIYGDTANAVNVEEMDYLYGTTTVNTYKYYDGLNRLVQTRRSATSPGVYKVADRSYNNVALLQTESLPYFGSGSAKSSPTSTPALFTTYTYDPLGRTLAITNAVGAVSNGYANWKTTTTDANGNPKDEYRDAYGNLIQVGEHNGASTYNTYYSYDGLRDLVSITDASGNVRNFSYDGLGREASSTDLHAAADTTYGMWSYGYDDTSNLTSRVDPKSQTVNYTYDNINRALTEDYTGQTGTEVAYSYDSCTNGAGRLCSVSSTAAVAMVAKTYDPLGNLASETKTIGGTNYTTAYTYDRQGDILTITNPDNSQIQYNYGPGGLVATVQEKESGGSFTPIISSLTYSPVDKVVKQVDANGMTTQNIYDPTRLYRLNSTVTTSSSTGMTGFAQGKGLQSMQAMQSLMTLGAGTSTVTEACTGAVTSYTVPSGATKLLLVAYGAQGGGGGGLGGTVAGTLAVTAGNTYYLNVGCQNGYGGGGGGGTGYQSSYNGAIGGGMTWFSASTAFSTSTALLVAGGGGGAGGQGNNSGTGSAGAGGVGGSPSGGAGGMGSSSYCSSSECAGGGGGGSQTVGGERRYARRLPGIYRLRRFSRAGRLWRRQFLLRRCRRRWRWRILRRRRWSG